MGLISKILSVARNRRNGVLITELKNDPGGGTNTTMGQFSTPGIDAQPLPGDYVVSVSIPGSKREAAIGTIDPGNDPVSDSGEVRLYARDVSGNVIAVIRIKNDGTILINNDKGSATLTPTGDLELNGNSDFAVRFNALQTAFDSLKATVDAHITAYNAAVYTIGGVGTTGTTSLPAIVSTADITPAKVDEVKLP